MKVRVVIFFITVCAFQIGNAQQVVPAGGHLSKQDVTVEWIIAGNLFNNVFVVNDDPGKKSAIVSEERKSASFKIYPSYTRDFVNVEIKNPGNTVYHLDAINSIGAKVIAHLLLEQSLTKLDLSDKTSGIYFLKIYQSENEQVIFNQKVIKL